MKLRSRIDTIDGWLQTAKEMLIQDAGKRDDYLGVELDDTAGMIGRVQDRLRTISDADGWRET